MISPVFNTHITEQTDTYGKFILEPLNQSFGQTVGNSLRRTLLSSLKGSAIVCVKIKGVDHLFSPLKGVKETALELVLHLKQTRFLGIEDKPVVMRIEKKGIGKIFAKDIVGEGEIVDKEIYIAEITDPKTSLEIEMYVASGYGYVDAEEQEIKETGLINVDSSFSPITKVNFKIEDARVGRKTNYERLILEIWTNGSIKPEDALKQAAQILSAQFQHILDKSADTSVEGKETNGSIQEPVIDKRFYDLIIDELNLPSRVVNALLRENIETVADLIKIGQQKLVGFKGLGKKSIDLISDELKKIRSGMDLISYAL